MNEAALARDRTALVALAASIPAIQAFAYERWRARAFAHALDGAGDAALAELSLAAAAEPPSAATLAADSAQLHLLLGDPARAVVALEGAARVADGLDPHAGAVLVAAIREAPAAWFRGARAAVLARSPRTTLATLGAGVRHRRRPNGLPGGGRRRRAGRGRPLLLHAPERLLRRDVCGAEERRHDAALVGAARRRRRGRAGHGGAGPRDA